MTWDSIEGGLDAVTGPRERGPAERQTAGGSAAARARNDLASGAEGVRLESSAGNRRPGAGRGRAPGSRLILAPVGSGRFDNAQRTISLNVEHGGVARLTLAREDGGSLVLHGMRAGGHLYLAGPESPVVRGEIVPLDDEGRFTLVGFESLASTAAASPDLPRGMLLDSRAHRFRTPGSEVVGRWDPETRQLDVGLNDGDGAAVLRARGLYGKATAVVQVPGEGVLGLAYSIPDERPGEVGVGSFMWVTGAIPLLPPLGGIWDALAEPLSDDSTSPDAERQDRVAPAMRAAGILPQGDPVLEWRRLAPALDSLAPRLDENGRLPKRRPASGDPGPHLFDSTA